MNSSTFFHPRYWVIPTEGRTSGSNKDGPRQMAVGTGDDSLVSPSRKERLLLEINLILVRLSLMKTQSSAFLELDAISMHPRRDPPDWYGTRMSFSRDKELKLFHVALGA
jgi:hypothetical protein